MKFTTITLFGLCANLVHSNPTPKGTKFLATFDDIPGSSLLPELNLVTNPYRSLYWSAYDVYGDATSLFTFPSGTQTAATFIGESILGGVQPGINITSAAPSVKSFDLDSLYLGCVISSQTALDPVDCTLVLTGTKKVDGGSVEHECSYSVKNNGLKFAFCELPTTFEGLVEVATKLKGLQQLTTVTFLDSVAGVTYT